MKRTHLFVVAAAVLAMSGCDNQTTGNTTLLESQLPFVEVQGTAEVMATPDRFQVRAAFSELGEDVGAMKSRLDSQMADALAAAKALGIDDSKVRASSLSVQPEWQWQPERKLIGQRVSRDLQITVDGLDLYVALLDRLAALGVSELHQASAEVRDLAALEDQVLKQAVANARHRAALLAGAAGRELGPAMVIIEQGTQLPGPMPMRAMAMEAAADKSAYSAGETTVRSQVQVRFRLD
ncbi:MAG: SIMPL domain-containing protein [Alcanivoracaceae bacterium]